MAEINWDKVRWLKPDEEIPPNAVKLHLYDYKNVLRPRGPMLKESLGLKICEDLLNSYEHWTNPEYGDNPDPKVLLETIKENLLDETRGAFELFIHCIQTGKNPWDVVYKNRK
jgi:hypothetical protein